MPAIRDWTFNYKTSTTGTTISAPLPAYEVGDLLLAILSSDTTAGTWSRSGWTQLFSTTNTCGLAVFWKIATAGEVDPVFTATTAETYNLHLISIRDVNTSTPFNGTGGAGTGYRTATNSAAVASMPQLTTTVPNSLVLYIVSESGAVVPGVHQGPVTFEDAADGSAHSEGFSWGFMPTAGPTPTTVKCNKNGTAAGVLATIGISPPAGGATVIPAYCAADASIYVDPIHGTTAFNGNTAFAATLTTHFGTSINGKTAANGTAAAAADVGINSFHNMGQVTGTATAGTWAGAALVLATANKPNVAGKNVLCHVKPSTPKVYQNTDPLAKVGVKGVFFGMCSTSASAFKVWHVHGAGTPWDSAQHVPIVINSLNTSGLIQSTGSLNDTSIASFGFGVSGFTVAPVFQFGSLWVLDTTVIAGGNAAEPVSVAGINKVCSTGKERMSVLQQGAGQILVLQPVQFGDGGTNPLYLNLDSTAIEFPQHYNLGTKQVFYCSADNVAGLTYYAGASDTIKHVNSVVSSASPYHWRIHASSHADAAYDFSGLQVIGAGDVQLKALTAPFAFMTFANCGTVTANGAKIEDTEFRPGAGVSGLTTGAPNLVKRCQFVSKGTGHGIVITTPGTYDFVGNIFTGYAATNGTTGNEAVYNNSGGAVTLNVTGGGTVPSVRNGAGASTTVNNAVPVTLENVVIGSRYRVFKKSDGSLLFEGEALSSQVDLIYGGTTPTPVVVRVRKSASGTRYQPFETEGSISSTGLSIYVKQLPDTTAAPVVPVTITGTFSVASGTPVTFNTTDIPGATYVWSIPTGAATITSGQGTSSVSVTSSTIGDYTLKCVVSKAGWDTGSDSRVVTVAASQPIAMKTTALVKDSNYSQAKATTAKVSPGVAVQAGDLILVIHTNDQAVATACTDNAAGGSNTYNRVGNGSFISNATTSITAFYAIAKATETITATITTTGTSYFTTSVILISGAKQDVNTVLDQFAYQTAEGAGSTSHTSASITTTNPDDLIICWWAEDTTSSGVTENGTGFTELPGSIDSYSNGTCTTCMYKVVSSTGTYYDQMTSSASTFFTSLIMAFKKA